MKQDQMSMAASIESRVPFLDDRLVEHVVAMPGDVKLPGWQTKAHAADRGAGSRAARDPHAPKMGFPVPLGRWFRGRFASVVDEFVLGPRANERGYFDHRPLRQWWPNTAPDGRRTPTRSGCSSISKSGFVSSLTVRPPAT